MAAERIKVGDIEMCFRWDGQASGPVVMMAHAMGTSHRLWDPQVNALGASHRILRYDWRGHGDTSAPDGPYSLAMFVDDACGLMDALGLDQVHWVGISTGGMIGQGLGIHRPERIASLALCNTTSLASPWYRDWVKERQAVVRRDGMDAVWDMTKRMWFTDDFVDAEPADYHAVREVFVRTPIPGYLAGTSAVADLAYQADLPRIKARTLVIAAGDDPVTPEDHARAIASRIPEAELVMLDGQRHFSNVEVPEVFSGHLLAHLGAAMR